MDNKPICILVLGKRLKPNGEPEDMLVIRMKEAAKLYDRLSLTSDCYIICSGGTTEKGDNQMRGKMPSEAHIMKSILEKEGISSLKIIKEDQSLTTVQNMERSLPLLRNRFKQVYLVTSEFHLDRSLIIFKNMIPEYKDRVIGIPIDSRLLDWQMAGERSIEIEMMSRYKERFPHWVFT